jgi:UDP-3-O-[3-hydroxymyristoyl] N-acetylglucosamine deacetylase
MKPDTGCTITGFTRAGHPVKMEIRPAPFGTGIIFNARIPALLRYARVENHSTHLRYGNHTITAVEHFLAACTGLGITDLEIKLSAPELPFGDGSSRPFVRSLLRAGPFNRATPLPLTEPVAVRAETGLIVALPAPGLKIHCLIDYPLTGEQFFTAQISRQRFIREIAPARTFGPATPEIEPLLRRLPFRVKNKGGWLFPDRLRFPDEPCRHKILDLLGDLALLGRPLQAEIFAYNPSHRLNLKFLRSLKRRLRVATD